MDKVCNWIVVLVLCAGIVAVTVFFSTVVKTIVGIGVFIVMVGSSIYVLRRLYLGGY